MPLHFHFIERLLSEISQPLCGGLVFYGENIDLLGVTVLLSTNLLSTCAPMIYSTYL